MKAWAEALPALALALLLAIGGRTAEIDLSLDPGLQFRTEEKPDKKETALVATLPLYPDQGGGRMVEIGFKLVGVWYYAPLRVGIKSAEGGTEFGLHFEKGGGDHDCECRLYARRNDKETVLAKWEAVDGAVRYRLILKWRADGKLEFVARNGIADVFRTTCALAPPFNVDALFLRVVNNKDNGFIGYDCEESGILMRSQPGGGEYVASAFIDSISMSAPRPGDAK